MDVRKTFNRLIHDLTQFGKDNWRSLLMLGVMGAVTGGAWTAPHAFNRLFPVTFFNGSNDIVWAQFAYPYQKSTFSSLSAAMVAILIPVGIILLAQIWIRSFCDAAYGILGLAYSLVTGTFMIVVLKKTIGGLRPHFLSVCQPVIPDTNIGKGFQNVMFTIEQVCTGNKADILTAIESFPSGHSEIAFAGLFYLSLYLFAHLKLRQRCRSGYWRMVACVVPTLLATYIASTLVLDYHHHSYDVIFGVLLGIITALFGYHMAFRGWVSDKPSCHESHEASLPK